MITFDNNAGGVNFRKIILIATFIYTLLHTPYEDYSLFNSIIINTLAIWVIMVIFRIGWLYNGPITRLFEVSLFIRIGAELGQIEPFRGILTVYSILFGGVRK